MMHLGMRTLIRRHFAEEIDAGERERLRAHLRTCRACCSAYDEAAELLRAAAGGAPTRAETSWLRAEVLGQVMPAATVAPPVRRPLLRHLAPAMAAALVVLLTVGVSYLRPEVPGSEVQLRGGATAPLVDLQLFAVGEAGGGFGLPRLVSDGGRVSLSEYIQFRYRNHSHDLRHLYLLGLDERLQPLDYFPRPDSEHSIAIVSTLTMQTVPRSIRLARRHQVGWLQVHALFSRRPLERSEVHRAVSQLSSSKFGGANVAAPARIDLGSDVVEVVHRFEVVKSDGL
jgi:hypothetical protein